MCWYSYEYCLLNRLLALCKSLAIEHKLASSVMVGCGATDDLIAALRLYLSLHNPLHLHVR